MLYYKSCNFLSEILWLWVDIDCFEKINVGGYAHPKEYNRI